MADDAFGDFGGGLDFGGDSALPDNASFTQGAGLDLSQSAGAGDGGGASAPSPSFPGLPFGRKLNAYNNRPQLNTEDPMQDRINAGEAARQRLQRSIDNPIRAFLKPREWQEDLKRAGEIDQQLLQAKQFKQQQADLKDQARAAGMDPDRIAKFGPTVTEQTIMNAWTDQLNTGSFTAAQKFLGMGEAGQKVLAQQEGLYMPALAARNDQAKAIVEKLDTAANTSQSAYESQLAQLRKNGVNVDAALSNYVPGFTTPTQADAWKVRGQGVQGALAKAGNMVQQYNQRNQQLGLSTPITDPKEAAAHLDQVAKGSYGDAIPGTNAIKLPSGEVGAKMAPGSNDPERNYGRTYSNESTANVKTFNEQLAAEQTKGALSDYKLVKKVHEVTQKPEAWTSAAGIAVIGGQLGAVERDLAEGSKAAGTVGLSKMMDAKYGHVGGWLNTAQREWSEFAAWVDNGKKGPAPRLSDNTINGIKDIVQFKYDQAAREVRERVGQPLTFAGYHGIDLSHTGLDKELQADPELRKQYDTGRNAYIDDVLKRPAIIEGTSRIMLREDSKNGQRFSRTKTAEENAQEAETKRAAAMPGRNGTEPSGPASPPPTLDKKAAPIYSAVAGTISNLGGPNTPPQYSRNVAAVLTGAAHSESGYDPNKSHDNGTGYGLFGHRLDRLDNMRKFAGVGPNDPVPPQTQAAFAARELDAIARHTPWVKQILDKPNPTAEELTKVQMYFEKPKGSVTKGEDGKARFTPENGHNWSGRLSKVASIIGSGVDAATNLIPPIAAGKAAFRALPDTTQQRIKDAAVEHAPAIGSTAGAVLGGAGGSAVAPGPGTVAGGVTGGAAGGAAGQIFKNWMQGKDLTEGVGKEAALGGVFGFAPQTRVVGPAARIAGGAIVGAGNEAITNPDAAPSDIIKEGLKTGAAATIGEAGGQVLAQVGRGLGMAGHKIWSRFHPDAQAELADAGAIIAKGKPEAPTSPAGVPVSPSAKAEYDKAVTEYDSAVQTAKDAGIDPDHLAYAVKQVEGGATKGEAAVAAPLERARKDLGEGFQAISEATGKAAPTATHGKPGAQKALADGPKSIVRSKDNPTGTVPAKFAEDAADAEMRVTAPAKTWQEKWDQLHKVQSDLLEKERNAIQSQATDKTERAEAMRALAETVHTQQAKIAQHVFGKDAAKVVMEQYNILRREYAKLMQLEGGKGLIDKVAKGDREARATLAQFDKFAGNDELAKMMVRRLAAAEKSGSKSVLVPMAAAQGLHMVPVVGTPAAMTITVAKAQAALRNMIVNRGAGKPAQLKDFLPQPAKPKGPNRAVQNAGRVGGAAAAMGAQQ